MGFGFIDSFMFTVFPIVFMCIFITFFIIFLMSLIRKAKQSAYNKTQPVLSVQATVVDKRNDCHTSTHMNNTTHMHDTHHYTYYYITFQVESGDRMEFEVQDTEFGMIVVGDVGKLTFQGTDYKGFERNR